jgi:hypothetical protein
MNITATSLLAIANADDLRSAANCAWHAANNAGEGYDPEGDDLGELVLAAVADDQVAIYRDGDDVVIVGDSNGPWGVRVRG